MTEHHIFNPVLKMTCSNVTSHVFPFSRRSTNLKVPDAMRNVIILTSEQLTHSMSSSERVELDPESSNIGTALKQFICESCDDDVDNSYILLNNLETKSKVRRAIKLLKKEKKKVEKEMRNNFELAREKMNENDACSSPRANRIVAAMAMDRVAKTEQSLEYFNIALKKLKNLKKKVKENALSYDDIDDEIAKRLNAVKNLFLRNAKLHLHSDDELLRSLNRALLKQALENL